MIVATIVIFFIAIGFAFGMPAFRAWELKTGRATMPSVITEQIPEFSFRQLEKYMLYLTKRAIQWIVLTAVKYWFIATTNLKKWVSDKWPKVHDFFKAPPKSPDNARASYVRRAVVESKIKIRRVKEKVKREHEEKIAVKEAQIGAVESEETPKDIV